MSGVVIEVSSCKRGWFVVWLDKQDLRVCVGSAVVCDKLRNVGSTVVCDKLRNVGSAVVWDKLQNVGCAVVWDKLRNVGCAVVCHKLQHSQHFVMKFTWILDWNVRISKWIKVNFRRHKYGRNRRLDRVKWFFIQLWPSALSAVC
jgi:hypothetical protein